MKVRKRLRKGNSSFLEVEFDLYDIGEVNRFFWCIRELWEFGLR